jgi:hypothetical protein
VLNGLFAGSCGGTDRKSDRWENTLLRPVPYLADQWGHSEIDFPTILEFQEITRAFGSSYVPVVPNIGLEFRLELAGPQWGWSPVVTSTGFASGRAAGGSWHLCSILRDGDQVTALPLSLLFTSARQCWTVTASKSYHRTGCRTCMRACTCHPCCIEG